jgi:hypothetical protein
MVSYEVMVYDSLNETVWQGSAHSPQQGMKRAVDRLDADKGTVPFHVLCGFVRSFEVWSLDCPRPDGVR